MLCNVMQCQCHITNLMRCDVMWCNVARCRTMWDSDEFLLCVYYDCLSEKASQKYHQNFFRDWNYGQTHFFLMLTLCIYVPNHPMINSSNKILFHILLLFRCPIPIFSPNWFRSVLSVGTLKDGYVHNVPLPRVPQIQSASPTTSHELIAPKGMMQVWVTHFVTSIILP